MEPARNLSEVGRRRRLYICVVISGASASASLVPSVALVVIMASPPLRITENEDYFRSTKLCAHGRVLEWPGEEDSLNRWMLSLNAGLLREALGVRAQGNEWTIWPMPWIYINSDQYQVGCILLSFRRASENPDDQPLEMWKMVSNSTPDKGGIQCS